MRVEVAPEFAYGQYSYGRDSKIQRLEDISFDLDLAAVFLGGNNSGEVQHSAGASLCCGSSTIGESCIWNEWNDDAYSAGLRPEQLIYTLSADVVSLGHNGKIREPRETWIEVDVHESGEKKCLIAVGRDSHGNVTLYGREKSRKRDSRYFASIHGLRSRTSGHCTPRDGAFARSDPTSCRPRRRQSCLEKCDLLAIPTTKGRRKGLGAVQKDIRELIPSLRLRENLLTSVTSIFR